MPRSAHRGQRSESAPGRRIARGAGLRKKGGNLTPGERIALNELIDRDLGRIDGPVETRGALHDNGCDRNRDDGRDNCDRSRESNRDKGRGRNRDVRASDGSTEEQGLPYRAVTHSSKKSWARPWARSCAESTTCIRCLCARMTRLWSCVVTTTIDREELTSTIRGRRSDREAASTTRTNPVSPFAPRTRRPSCTPPTQPSSSHGEPWGSSTSMKRSRGTKRLTTRVAVLRWTPQERNFWFRVRVAPPRKRTP